MFASDCVAHMLVVCWIYIILKSHFLVDGVLNFQEGRHLNFVIARTRSRLDLLVLEPVDEFYESYHGEDLCAALHSNNWRIIVGYLKSNGLFLDAGEESAVFVL